MCYSILALKLNLELTLSYLSEQATEKHFTFIFCFFFITQSHSACVYTILSYLYYIRVRAIQISGIFIVWHLKLIFHFSTMLYIFICYNVVSTLAQLVDAVAWKYPLPKYLSHLNIFVFYANCIDVFARLAQISIAPKSTHFVYTVARVFKNIFCTFFVTNSDWSNVIAFVVFRSEKSHSKCFKIISC